MQTEIEARGDRFPPDEALNRSSVPHWSLAWQYAPGVWATVGDMSGNAMPLDKARTVAGLVEIGDGGALPNPLPQDRH